MAELDKIIETAIKLKLNTLLLQVHPCSDALYSSDMFPVSKFLSTEKELYFDPLEYMVTECHKNGISIFAWMNPFRVTVKKYYDKNIALNELDNKIGPGTTPELLILYDGRLYYDLGEPQVKEIISSSIEEIITGYAIDGIVFDDYFYPYPTETDTFDDSKSFNNYSTGESRDEWRRNNINEIIKECFNTVKKNDQSVLFGIAPFGIWKNGNGGRSGSFTAGLESYSAIYCDSLAWIDGGYIDFVSPQLYWDSETASSFNALYRWWNEILDGTGVVFIPSLSVYKYENDWKNPSGIMTCQITSLRKTQSYGGAFYYGFKQISNNTNGVAEEIIKINNSDNSICEIQKYPFDLKNEYPKTGTLLDLESIYPN